VKIIEGLEEHKLTIQEEAYEEFSDFIVFIPYMPKISK
jgi:hypothetical protein